MPVHPGRGEGLAAGHLRAGAAAGDPEAPGRAQCEGPRTGPGLGGLHQGQGRVREEGEGAGQGHGRSVNT